MTRYLEPIARYFSDDSSIYTMKSDKEIMDFLLEIGISKDEIIKLVKEFYTTDYIDLKTIKISSSLAKKLKLEILQRKGVLPYKELGDVYFFAIADINNQPLKDTLINMCKEQNYRAKFAMAFDFEIQEKYQEFTQSVSSNIEVTDASSFLEELIGNGIKIGCSDIHLEPLEDGVRVRYRVDGVLSVESMLEMSSDMYVNIISKIKVESNMDIAEKRKPQDGRIDDFIYNDRRYDIRVSSVCTINGEKIVMRLFDKDRKQLTFEDIGFPNNEIDTMTKLINEKNGIVYISGATGSGKTTTLYTMIESLDRKFLNIYSIEDPVEKSMTDVNQIQIDVPMGITYPAILKSLLRQDPDVIVVGEIRDQETAELSIKASLTGHLVFATIHSNNSVDTITRLLDMDIKPYLIGASSLGFISQRLVRKLCPHCREKVTVPDFEAAFLKAIEDRYHLPPSPLELYTSKGCEYCSGTGFKGRSAVTEVFLITPEIRSQIVNKENIQDIYYKAVDKGFVPLELNAYYKALNGITSVSEIMKVV